MWRFLWWMKAYFRVVRRAKYHFGRNPKWRSTIGISFCHCRRHLAWRYDKNRWSEYSTWVETPKSASLATPLSESKMFAALMSRWILCCEWRSPVRIASHVEWWLWNALVEAPPMLSILNVLDHLWNAPANVTKSKQEPPPQYSIIDNFVPSTKRTEISSYMDRIEVG